MSLICNYAIARFLPYAETEEFVNVGVVLHCASTGYLSFQLTHKWSRVTDFFPEIQDELYRNASRLFRVDLESASLLVGEQNPQQLVMDQAGGEDARIFAEIVRPRESLFRFGKVRTVMADDPEAKLSNLYRFYVDRQFAREREYQETLMTRHLRKLFLKTGTLHYRQETLGNELYSVTIPFVYRKGEVLERAIKPLDLNKTNSTKIIEHGDLWINRVRRLQEISSLPRQLLFAVKAPQGGESARLRAAREIEAELVKLKMIVIPFTDEARVVEFAKVA